MPVPSRSTRRVLLYTLSKLADSFTSIGLVMEDETGIQFCSLHGRVGVTWDTLEAQLVPGDDARSASNLEVLVTHLLRDGHPEVLYGEVA